MASIDQQPAGRPDSGLSFIPVAWLVIVMGLSAYGLMSNWRLIGDFSLPDNVLFLIYGGLAGERHHHSVGAVPPWSRLQSVGPFPAPLHDLAGRHHHLDPRALRPMCCSCPTSSSRPRGWASPSPRSPSVCSVSISCATGNGAETVYANLETERPPVFVSILAALLGIVLGGVIGHSVRFFAGSLIADLTRMSCFEGACRFFAAFVGLGGLIVGAIAGGAFAIWRVNRRRPARAR
ncbi:hypothetical protein ACVOMV_00955 [Mesorhizobium atlanticum]